MMMISRLFLSALILGTTAALPGQANPAIDALVAAYPDHLAGYEGNELVWKDGTRMPIDDGRKDKTREQMIEEPDIKDQFAIPYPLGPGIKPPAWDQNPGRSRNEVFFLKMYGDCRKGEVSPRLARVPWLPARNGGSIVATTINGVADRLAAVSKDLETLPADMTRYLVPPGGVYNCRTIADTKRLSVHSFGAALDINSRFGDYWFWAKKSDGEIVWKNRVPGAIGEIFERHGFIWGAKWYHFDTFHFEYRPELIALARKGGPVK
jgi:hypothetical protein